MTIIKKLRKDVINKIAAGQVVSNPANVVKELIENSIDAKAKNIIIEIHNGGLEKIKVIDDGFGIANDDLPKSFQPHTTSKISLLNDLENISSLGFRGEALSSICAVSRVRIRSKHEKEEMGREIVVNDNSIVEDAFLGMPTGTLVEVSSLFGNIPARRKFLNSPTKEGRDVLDTILSYVLAFPDIGFKFYRDDKLVFSFSGSCDLKISVDRLNLVLGKSVVDNLFPINEDFDNFSIQGFLSYPQASTSEKPQQFIFINGRHVIYKSLISLISNVYGNLVEHDKNPPLVLFITFPADKVDVNIHPKKESVSIENEQEYLEIIAEFIDKALSEQDLSYVSSREDNLYERVLQDNMYISLRESVEKWTPMNKNSGVIQVDKTFIMTPHPEGLLVLDQHAAHESVLFDQYMEALENKLPLSSKCKLKPPLTFTLGISDYEEALSNLEYLRNLGFDIDSFGKNSLRVSSIPDFYKDYDIEVLIKDFVNDFSSQEFKTNKTDVRTRKIVSFLACRGAIKAGDILSEDSMHNLIEKVSKSKNNYTCPHGRPAKIIIKTKDLMRMFKRI